MKENSKKMPQKAPESIPALKEKNRKLKTQIDKLQNKILKLENKTLKQVQIILKLKEKRGPMVTIVKGSHNNPPE